MLFCRCALSLPFGVSWSVVSISRARCHSRSLSAFAFTNVFILNLPLKLYNRIQKLNCNKAKFLEHLIVNILVCDVLCVITSVMAPRKDLDLD
jgi:hypothetical protein